MEAVSNNNCELGQSVIVGSQLEELPHEAMGGMRLMVE